MEQKVCIIDLDFIVGFAFIDLVSNYGRTAISEYRVEKYLNQIISSLNMYFKDVQFLPGFLDKSKIKNDFFKYDSNTERFLLFKNVKLKDFKKYYHNRVEIISNEYNLNYNLFLSIMESNINTFVLHY